MSDASVSITMDDLVSSLLGTTTPVGAVINAGSKPEAAALTTAGAVIKQTGQTLEANAANAGSIEAELIDAINRETAAKHALAALASQEAFATKFIRDDQTDAVEKQQRLDLLTAQAQARSTHTAGLIKLNEITSAEGFEGWLQRTFEEDGVRASINNAAHNYNAMNASFIAMDAADKRDADALIARMPSISTAKDLAIATQRQAMANQEVLKIAAQGNKESSALAVAQANNAVTSANVDAAADNKTAAERAALQDSLLASKLGVPTEAIPRLVANSEPAVRQSLSKLAAGIPLASAVEAAEVYVTMPDTTEARAGKALAEQVNLSRPQRLAFAKKKLLIGSDATLADMDKLPDATKHAIANEFYSSPEGMIPTRHTTSATSPLVQQVVAAGDSITLPSNKVVKLHAMLPQLTAILAEVQGDVKAAVEVTRTFASANPQIPPADIAKSFANLYKNVLLLEALSEGGTRKAFNLPLPTTFETAIPGRSSVLGLEEQQPLDAASIPAVTAVLLRDRALAAVKAARENN